MRGRRLRVLFCIAFNITMWRRIFLDGFEVNEGDGGEGELRSGRLPFEF